MVFGPFARRAAVRLAQGKSLATNSKDTVVTIHYTRPESHVPHDNVVTADRAEDGSYTAKLRGWAQVGASPDTDGRSSYTLESGTAQGFVDSRAPGRL